MDPSSSFAVRPAAAGDLAAVRRLLAAAGLPGLGLEEQFGEAFAVAEAGGGVVGAEGIEVYGNCGLLRSAVVIPEWQGRGVGEALTTDRLTWARRRGLRAVYLLTTTAKRYFPRFGFEPVERVAVPAEIRASREFAEECPETATVMTLVIG